MNEDYSMREATKEERESVRKYVESISKPTGVNFYNLLDEKDTKMEAIVRIVRSDNWKALYINNNKLAEGHSIGIKEVCDTLQYLIESRGIIINKIVGENYYLSEEYAEDNGFPLLFDEIPKNMFE